MEIVFFGKGERGKVCLEELVEIGYDIPLVVSHAVPYNRNLEFYQTVMKHKLDYFCRDIMNYNELQPILRGIGADVFVLAGYGKILKKDVLDIPKIMTINLHAGKLPEYRGSSPMNWALINGERTFTITIIKVDEGIDTGDILMESTYNIRPDDTIRELQNFANIFFPLMMLDCLKSIEEGTYKLKPQIGKAAYYRARIPQDSEILPSKMMAEYVHNLIRASQEPYPAYLMCKGKKLKILESKL